MKFLWIVSCWWLACVSASVSDELHETERMIALQEAKLAQLRTMRLSLSGASDGLMSEVAQMSNPSSIDQCASIPSSVYNHIMERNEMTLDGIVLIVQPLRLPYPLLFIATNNGQLNFCDFPSSKIVASMDTGVQNVKAVTFLHREDLSMGFVSVFSPSQRLHYNVTLKYGNINITLDSVHPVEGTLVTAVSSTFHGEQIHFIAKNDTSMDVLVPSMDGTNLQTISSLISEPILIASHRHLLVVAQGTDAWLFPIGRIGEQVQYVCQGSRADIVALGFDAGSSNIMYAGLSTGDILVFDLFADRTRQCRLLHRIPPSSHVPEAITTLPGILLIATKSSLHVYNVSDVVLKRPSYLYELRRSVDIASEYAPSISIASLQESDGEGAMQRHALALARGQSILLMETIFPALNPPTSLLEGWFSRIPLLLVVVLSVVAVRIFLQKSPNSVSQLPPSSMESDFQRMMESRKSTYHPPPTPSAERRYDPTFDPTFDPSYASDCSRPNRFHQTEVY